MSVVSLALGWGLLQWSRHFEQRSQDRQYQQQIEDWVDQGRRTAQSEGKVVRLRIDGDQCLMESGDSPFSTRWRKLDSRPLPPRWSLESGGTLLLLPHGRPVDSVQWDFVTAGSDSGRGEFVSGWRLLFFLSGPVEWERWKR
ncbi:MAG: hypothetical protein JJU20_09565 [Opitutales bacterium]|nr:hypothetical protein [Opitutales bacterium]